MLHRQFYVRVAFYFIFLNLEILLLCVYDVDVRGRAHTFEAARVHVRGQLLGGRALRLLLCRFVDG